jgi:hypothetical protein
MFCTLALYQNLKTKVAHANMQCVHAMCPIQCASCSMPYALSHAQCRRLHGPTFKRLVMAQLWNVKQKLIKQFEASKQVGANSVAAAGSM